MLKMFVVKFDIDESKIELKRRLRDLTDEDYSRHNGSDYYVDYDETRVSMFDRKWGELKDKDLRTIVFDILTDCYSNNYYKHYCINMEQVLPYVIVSVSYVDED